MGMGHTGPPLALSLDVAGTAPADAPLEKPMSALNKLHIVPLLCGLALSAGCNIESGLTALDELLVTSLSGEEDSANAAAGRAEGEEQGEQQGGGPGGEGADQGDRSGPPPMFRDCNAGQTYEGYVDAYDEDGSGDIDSAEGQEIVREHAGPKGGSREHFLHMLQLVYDVDADQQLNAEERDAAFSDFTERCEAIHEEVLATYDADGDGVLSETEQEAAREGHLAEVEAEREQTAACEQTCSRDREAERQGARGAEGEESGAAGPAEAGAPWGPLEMEFDADENGELSESELATLRETMRERIRSGERPQRVCEDLVD